MLVAMGFIAFLVVFHLVASRGYLATIRASEPQKVVGGRGRPSGRNLLEVSGRPA